MSDTKQTITRRNAIRRIAAVSTAITLSGQFTIARAEGASNLAPLDPTTPNAINLGYVEDANMADTVKFAKRAAADGPTQFCNTCQFFGGKPADESGSCVIFPGSSVKATGWCNSWFKRVG